MSMPTHRFFTLLASLALAAGVAAPLGAAPVATSDNVTVAFQNPDEFTDVHENGSMTTSSYYLDQLKACLQTTAAPRLAAGQRLAITVTDIDLAGDNVLQRNPDHIRIMKDIYAPRVELAFRLVDGDGKVLKEGKRTLTDSNYLQNLRLPGAGNDPLYFDKELLKRWVHDEFRAKA